MRLRGSLYWLLQALEAWSGEGSFECCPGRLQLTTLKFQRSSEHRCPDLQRGLSGVWSKGTDPAIADPMLRSSRAIGVLLRRCGRPAEASLLLADQSVPLQCAAFPNLRHFGVRMLDLPTAEAVW